MTELMSDVCLLSPKGMGFALSYTPAVAMVGMYFRKKKALAYGLAMSGSGIGTFVLAPVVQVLIERYSWRGALLILGGLVSHLCICAALLKPVEGQETEGEELKKGYVVSLADANGYMMNLPDAKGDAKGYMVNLPDAKCDAKLTPNEQADSKLVNGKPVGEILKVKQAGDATLPDWSSTGGVHLINEKSFQKSSQENTDGSDSKLTTQNLPKAEHAEGVHVMNVTSDNMCLLPERLETCQGNTVEGETQLVDTQPETQDPLIGSDHTESRQVESETLDDIHFSPTHSQTSETSETTDTEAGQLEEEITTHTNTKPLTQYSPATTTEHSKPMDPTPQDSTLATPKLPDAKLCELELQCAKLVEAKLLQMRWESSVTPVRGRWNRWCRIAKGCRLCLPPTEEYGFLLMTDFLLLSVSFLFLAYGCSVPFVYLVPYALSVGVSHQQAALLISVLGVIGIVGNITFGWMTDWR